MSDLNRLRKESGAQVFEDGKENIFKIVRVSKIHITDLLL